MREAKELAVLLRNWQSRERGEDFEEIAQKLEMMSAEIEHLTSYTSLLQNHLQDLQLENCELRAQVRDLRYYG